MLYEGFQCEGYELAPDAPLVTGLSAAADARDGQSAAAVRVDRDDRRADVPPLRRHARGLLRARSEGEHGIDERVHLPSITTTAQAIALFIADWCGVSAAASAG